MPAVPILPGVWIPRARPRQRRRTRPVGVFLGTWRNSGLEAAASPSVYGSRDRRGRINRRLSKWTPAGVLVTGGNYSAFRTSCTHDDVLYAVHFQGLGREEIDRRVGRQLAIEEGPGGGVVD